MKTSTKRFLLVDDDPLNNMITKMALKNTLGEIELKEFLIPELALEYIENEYKQEHLEGQTTLLLDINMPTLTGWEFLDKFKTFSNSIKNQFDIYILSSSIDPADIEQAKLHPLVIDFIEKPIKKEAILKTFIESALYLDYIK